MCVMVYICDVKNHCVKIWKQRHFWFYGKLVEQNVELVQAKWEMEGINCIAHEHIRTSLCYFERECELFCMVGCIFWSMKFMPWCIVQDTCVVVCMRRTIIILPGNFIIIACCSIEVADKTVFYVTCWTKARRLNTNVCGKMYFVQVVLTSPFLNMCMCCTVLPVMWFKMVQCILIRRFVIGYWKVTAFLQRPHVTELPCDR